MKAKTLLLFCLIAGTAIAQKGRLAIWVNGKTPDSVGESFVYQLREEIAHSALYSLADSEKDTFLGLSVLSVSVTGDNANNPSSAVSIVLFLVTKEYGHTFLDHYEMVVGSQKTLEMAQRLMASVDSDVQALDKALNTGRRKAEDRPIGP